MHYTIQPINHIAESGLALFPHDRFTIDPETSQPQGIVLRSANLHEHAFNPELEAIARAGAGTNNIPIKKLTQLSIPVMNTPGANANAVKELVLAALLIGSRHVIAANQAVNALIETGEALSKKVESIKKTFSGKELPGRKIGVIGLGKIGVLVANACAHLGMDVWGFDPHISVDNAWQLDARVHQATDLTTAVSQAEYLTVHVPLIDATKGLINQQQLALLADQATVINFARGGVVNQDDILSALQQNKLNYYLSDFPSETLRGEPKAIALPHLGASTGESADNCAKMACLQLRDYLLLGHTTHCINFPNLTLSTTTKHRLCVFNDNVPNMVAQISQMLSEADINISNLTNRSKGELAYNLIDIDKPCNNSIIQAITAIPGVNKLRALQL